MLLESVLKTIKEDNLLEETRKAGDVLLKGLKEAQDKFPGLVHSARGIGTYCAINADTSARYDMGRFFSVTTDYRNMYPTPYLRCML